MRALPRGASRAGHARADPTLRLVGINYKDDPENARRFLGGLGNPYAAVGVDPKGRAAIDWGVYGVPETFVVGPDGTIRYKFVGPLTEAALATVLSPGDRQGVAQDRRLPQAQPCRPDSKSARLALECGERGSDSRRIARGRDRDG